MKFRKIMNKSWWFKFLNLIIYTVVLVFGKSRSNCFGDKKQRVQKYDKLLDNRLSNSNDSKQHFACIGGVKHWLYFCSSMLSGLKWLLQIITLDSYICWGIDT